MRDLVLSNPESRTDLANSRRFIKHHGDKVRFCYQWKSWLIWDDKRWAEDRTGEIERLGKMLPDCLWDEAKNLGDDGARKFAANSGSVRAIRAMLDLAKSERPIEVGEMDQDGWLLNCKNGTLDLKTGKLRARTRDDMITKLCPTAYEPEAQSDVWKSFLNSTFGRDQELIDYVQKLFGYCLTAQTREQILPVFWGEGANGKSTLLTAFMETIGTDYAMKAPQNLLLAKRHESHPTELADLRGTRFVACVETPDEARLNETLVKELTGGDRIRARRMYRDSFEFEPTHKLVLCTNFKPRVAGTDHGIWRRLALVPFSQRFWDPTTGGSGPRELKVDPKLSEKLSNAREAILAWCVCGCLSWQKRGLEQPSVVRDVTAEYRNAEDIIAQWVKNRCVESPGSELRSKDAFSDYKAWCLETGESPASKQKFGAWMKKRFGSKRSNGIWYLGVRVNS